MQSTYSHMTTVGVASNMDDRDSDEDTLPSNGTILNNQEGGSPVDQGTKLLSGGFGRAQLGTSVDLISYSMLVLSA